jgi:hypothetical protein
MNFYTNGQEVSILQSEADACLHADRVIQSYRRWVDWDFDPNARDLLCAVNLAAAVLNGTPELHWIEAVLRMSDELFRLREGERYNSTVWHSVICNGGRWIEKHQVTHHTVCAPHTITLLRSPASSRRKKKVIAHAQEDHFLYQTCNVCTGVEKLLNGAKSEKRHAWWLPLRSVLCQPQYRCPVLFSDNE